MDIAAFRDDLAAQWRLHLRFRVLRRFDPGEDGAFDENMAEYRQDDHKPDNVSRR